MHSSTGHAAGQRLMQIAKALMTFATANADLFRRPLCKRGEPHDSLCGIRPMWPDAPLTARPSPIITNVIAPHDRPNGIVPGS